MRWLPARAWENGVYAVFSNPIGLDDDTIKPGLAMILDPFGEVLAESQALDDDVVVALLTAEKIEQSSGRRYLRARRPSSTASSSSRRPPARSQSPCRAGAWRGRRTRASRRIGLEIPDRTARARVTDVD